MAETLDVAGELVTVSCDNHREELASGLWNFFQSSYAVDFVTQWGGRSILAHRLILDVFLSPEKLGPSARGAQPEKPSGSGLDRQSCLASLVEFLYTGKVTIHKGQLPNLLEAARESDFKMLVEAVELTTAKMASEEAELAINHTVIKEEQISEDEGAPGSTENHIEWQKEEPDAIDTNHEYNMDLDPQMEVPGEPEFVDADEDAAPAIKRRRRNLSRPTSARSDVHLDDGLVGTLQVDHSQPATSKSRISKSYNNFKCDYCEKRFPQSRNLEVHTRIHTLHRAFKCSHCPRSFAYLVSLTGHLKHSHGYLDKNFPAKLQIEPESYQPHQEAAHVCKECGKSFVNQGYLERHMISHTSTEVHRCHVCSKTFSYHTGLSYHLRMHVGATHGNMSQLITQQQRVPIVRKSTSSGTSDKKQAAADVLHGCEVCGKKMLSVISLRRHQRIHHGSTAPSERPALPAETTIIPVIPAAPSAARRYNCGICKKKFSRLASLNMHCRLHKGFRPFKCEHCKRSFARSDQRNVHSRVHMIHTRKKLFKCPRCPKTYAHSISLKKHISKHAEADDGSGRPDEAFNHTVIKEEQILEDEDAPGSTEDQIEWLKEEPDTVDTNLEDYLFLDRQMEEPGEPESVDADEDAAPAVRMDPTPTVSGSDIQHDQRYSHDDFCGISSAELQVEPPGDQPHPKDDLVCSVCGKSFQNVVSLKRHMTSHNGTKDHQCHVCSKSFACKQGLTIHLRSHVIATHGELSRLRVKKQPASSVTKSSTSGISSVEAGTAKAPNHLRSHVGATNGDQMQPLAKQRRVKSVSKTTSVDKGASELTKDLIEWLKEEPNAVDTNHEDCMVLDPQIEEPGELESVDADEDASTAVKLEPTPTVSGSDVQHDDGFIATFLVDPSISKRHKNFKCDYCNKRFLQSRNLEVHTRIHTFHRSFKCRYCSKSFAYLVSLTGHLKYSHSDFSKIEPDSYQPHQVAQVCKECGKSFINQAYLMRHMKSHTSTEVHRCHVCSKTFSYKMGISNHIRMHVGATHGNLSQLLTQQQRVSIVGKSTSSGASDKKQAAAYALHGCEVCGKQMLSVNSLRRHRRTHSGSTAPSERPSLPAETTIDPVIPATPSAVLKYNCGICKKNFANSASLNMHCRLHTGFRPFKCEHCERSFTRKDQCNVHSRVHTRKKPVKCPRSPKTYAPSTSLKVHISKHAEAVDGSGRPDEDEPEMIEIRGLAPVKPGKFRSRRRRSDVPL